MAGFESRWIQLTLTPRALTLRAFQIVLLVIALVGAGRALRAAPPLPSQAPPPSFDEDIVALLSRAGCNRGVCHGNKNGKGGFKLSLRGQDPDADHAALALDVGSRRVDRIRPEASLLLLKATASVPHEGGQRFGPRTADHEMLRDWIADGLRRRPFVALRSLEVEPRDAIVRAPQSTLELRVTASYADGSRRDVTALATYEVSEPAASCDAKGRVSRTGSGEVTVVARYLGLQVPARVAFIPARPELSDRDFPASEHLVDRRAFRRLRELGVRPAPVCDDSTFVRRVSIDLLGRLPDAEEARAFVQSDDPARRERLVRSLLARPEFAETWALRWSDLLRNEEKVLDRKGVQAFHGWIRRAFAEGMPLDRFAREILTARGSSYSEPATNLWRALRDPVSRAESVAQVFLGTRLACAKCHNHPFDRWTQDDYWSWTALFSRVRYKIVENRRRDSNDKHEFVGEQIVWFDREGEVVNPRDGSVAPARFLGADQPLDPGAEPLEELARWLTSPENPFFARALVNRVWFHLFGWGLVDPVDDFRSTNPAVLPELLDDLAAEFRDRGYSLRWLLETIVSSQTYQARAGEQVGDDGSEPIFARARIRRLSAEQIIDAWSDVLGVPATFEGYPQGLRAGQLPGVSAKRPRDASPTGADEFLKAFGKPERLLSCECERSEATTLVQALQLLSGEHLARSLADERMRWAREIQTEGVDETVEGLWWSALARAPSAAERRAMREHIESAASPREGVEDVVWSVLGSKEFLFRR